MEWKLLLLRCLRNHESSMQVAKNRDLVAQLSDRWVSANGVGHWAVADSQGFEFLRLARLLAAQTQN